MVYDWGGEEHYNLISAYHKSIRNSDPDAALYWLFRMLEGGEDALYIARRLVRAASEDVGNADPQALRRALDAKDAIDFLGMPEGGAGPGAGHPLPGGGPQVQPRLPGPESRGDRPAGRPPLPRARWPCATPPRGS